MSEHKPQEAANTPANKLATAFATLEAMQPRWSIETGQPNSPGWMPGDSLRDAESGDFNQLLSIIGTRLKTQRRKVIAACFGLRFGWSSGVAFGPFLINKSVADVQLGNLSLKFSEIGLFEKTAFRQLQTFNEGAHWQSPMQQLQAALVTQAEPIVETLHQWSRFSRQGMWAQIASSWGAQCAQLLQALDRSDETLPFLNEFFSGSSLPVESIPRFYPVTLQGHRRYYHESASCCLYYKVSERYCSSCPLIDEDERLSRNKAWLQKTVVDEQ